jgi:ethanolamine utilization protein EutA
VTNREVLYRSDHADAILVGDQNRYRQGQSFIHRAYEEAGLTPEDIDTGAVIIWRSAEEKNAQPIVEFFAKYSENHLRGWSNHEALLAAYGCGAVDLSSPSIRRFLMWNGRRHN